MKGKYSLKNIIHYISERVYMSLYDKMNIFVYKKKNNEINVGINTVQLLKRGPFWLGKLIEFFFTVHKRYKIQMYISEKILL